MDISEGEQEVHNPPPPLKNDLVAIMAKQTCLMEVIAQGLTHNKNHRQGNGFGYPRKIIEFLKTNPPTFDSSDEPLAAISKKLNVVHADGRDRIMLASHQLQRSASDWWDNFCMAGNDAEIITWEEFQDEFRRYHIPKEAMYRKADEFRVLKQGAMTIPQ